MTGNHIVIDIRIRDTDDFIADTLYRIQNWQKIVLLHVSGHSDNRWIFNIHIEQLLDMGRNKDGRRFDHPSHLSNSLYHM